MRRVERGFGLAALLCAWLLAASSAMAGDDQVVLQAEGRAGRVTIRGDVTEFTGTTLTLKLQSGGLRNFPSEQVVEVRTARTTPHERALAQLAAGDARAAEESLQAAIAAEPRVWVRRELVALLVQTASRRQDLPSAAARFRSLLASDPSTRYFHVIPLSWVAEPLSPATRSEAATLMVAGEPVLRLIGASVLLEEPQHAEEATLLLRRLAVDPDPRVHELAQVQLWRTRLDPGQLTLAELERWRQRIVRLPPKLRGGPYHVLGRGYLVLREYELAATAFLWLPLVHDEQYHLSARSALAAADALVRIGHADAAAGLYREVETRYRDSAFAQEASSARRQLEPASAAEPGASGPTPGP